MSDHVPSTPRLVTLARIDSEGLLLGYQPRVPLPDPLPADCLVVPDGCDHAPGRARWDFARGHWVAVAPELPSSDALPPNALRAIHRGFVALTEQGLTLPPETLRWMQHYAATIDAKG